MCHFRIDLCRRQLPLLLAALLAFAGCSREPAPRIGEERIGPDEAAIEQELIRFTRQITLDRREQRKDHVLRRFNQPKTIACLQADFVVGRLPESLSVGLFARPARYPATLRFANATKFDDREADLRGLSIKVRDVPGAVGPGGMTGVQDFTFNNYPALFAGTPGDFLKFVRATAKGRAWAYFLNPIDSHLGSLMIVLRARSTPSTPFAERYFSTTPYRFGENSGAAVKYAVQACEVPHTTAQEDAEDFLRAALASNLAAGDVCLDFMVQFQTDAELMPIEDASVIWPEKISPFQKVAQLHISKQDFQDAAQMQACEAMQFNPWNGLAAHQPLGGINRVRKNLYHELGRFRSEQNESMNRGSDSAAPY